MTVIVEQFKALLGVDMEPGAQKALEDMEGSVDDIIGGLGKMAVAAAAAVAALVTATTITNKHTAVQTNLANALGISAEALETYGFLLGAIGMDGDSVIKTMRVLNDRIGELAQGATASATLRRAVGHLNLEFKDLQALSPEKQFEAILQASQDATDGQLAMSAATELLGREGVKLVGWVRTQSRSVAELLELQRQLNLQTDEGRDGAVRMTAAMDNLGAATESIWALFSGLVGDALAPIVEAFNDWVAANRELIQIKIKEWAEGFGKLVAWLVPKVRAVINVVTDLWQRFDKFISSTIGWERFVKILSVAMGALLAILAVAGVLKFIIVIQKMILAFKALKLAALGPILILLGLALALEDVYTFLEGGESVTGKFIKALEEYLGLDLTTPIREAWPEIKQFFIDVFDVFSQYLTGMIQTLAGWVKLNIDVIGNLVRFIVDIFTKGLGPAWDAFTMRMTASWHEFAENIKAVFVDALNFINNKFQSVMKPIRGFISKAASFVGVDLASRSAQSEAISSGALRGAAFDRSGGTSTTNGGDVNVGGITVVQQPGESGTGIAQRVRGEIEKMAAGAMRANSKGVEY